MLEFNKSYYENKIFLMRNFYQTSQGNRVCMEDGFRGVDSPKLLSNHHKTLPGLSHTARINLTCRIVANSAPDGVSITNERGAMAALIGAVRDGQVPAVPGPDSARRRAKSPSRRHSVH